MSNTDALYWERRAKAAEKHLEEVNPSRGIGMFTYKELYEAACGREKDLRTTIDDLSLKCERRVSLTATELVALRHQLTELIADVISFREKLPS